MQLRSFAIAVTAAAVALLVVAGGAWAQTLPNVQAALPATVQDVLSSTPELTAPAMQVPQNVIAPAPAPTPSPSASPKASQKVPAAPASVPAPAVRSSIPTITTAVEKQASSASVNRSATASSTRREPPRKSRQVSGPAFVRPASPLAPPVELGSGGPPRPSHFQLLWQASNGADMIGLLRALAALGALLTLSGLLARRATRPWLPG